MVEDDDSFEPFNRTTVECKLIWELDDEKEAETFNRTTVECKYLYRRRIDGLSLPLIELQ